MEARRFVLRLQFCTSRTWCLLRVRFSGTSMEGARRLGEKVNPSHPRHRHCVALVCTFSVSQRVYFVFALKYLDSLLKKKKKSNSEGNFHNQVISSSRHTQPTSAVSLRKVQPARSHRDEPRTEKPKDGDGGELPRAPGRALLPLEPRVSQQKAQPCGPPSLALGTGCSGAGADAELAALPGAPTSAQSPGRRGPAGLGPPPLPSPRRPHPRDRAVGSASAPRGHTGPPARPGAPRFPARPDSPRAAAAGSHR